jgi:hypothetical protein
MYKQEGQLIHQEHDEHGAIEIGLFLLLGADPGVRQKSGEQF